MATDSPTLTRRLSWAVTDAVTMSERTLRLTTRNIDALLLAVMLPVMTVLLFVYVFGGAMNTGTDYVNYVVPGIIVLCTGYGSSMTAVAVCQDKVAGIIDRFRSMAILRSAVLIGHVVTSIARNAVSTALVVAVAVLTGFRPSAGLVEWVAAVAILALFVLAVTWVSVAVGVLADSVDAASGYTFFVLFLPYVSSAFVPTETMPSWLRFVAENQPSTPVIETVRGLLMGTPIGASAWLAVAWCLGILVAGCLAASLLFRRAR